MTKPIIRGPGSPGRLLQAGAPRFRNMSGETAPPYAVMKIDSWYYHSKYGPIPQIIKPTRFGSRGDHIINGPEEVPDLEYGFYTGGDPIIIDMPAATPAGGLRLYYGPYPGDWNLHANVGGFRFLGSYGNDGILIHDPLINIRCILSGDLLSGEAAAATPTYWATSGWQTHACSMIVREGLGTTDPIDSGSVVWASLDGSSGEYIVTAVGCE